MKNRYPHHKHPSEEQLDTIRKEAHTTYNVNYHCVWIPKYRRRILATRSLKRILEEIIRGQCEQRDWKVLALEIQPDHIHLFVSVQPKYAVSYVMNIIKGNTSIQLRRIYPALKLNMGRSLWADGYYVSTAGFISENKVKRYIEDQIHHLRQQEYHAKFGGKQRGIGDFLTQSPPPFPLHPEGRSFQGSY